MPDMLDHAASARRAPNQPAHRPIIALDGPRLFFLILVLLFELSWVALPARAQPREAAQIAETIIETRLRPEPSLRSQPLLRLPAGVEVLLHGTAANGWYHAQHGQLEGFLRSGDVATTFLAANGASADVAPDEAIDEPAMVEQAQRAGARQRQNQAGNDRKGSKEERKKERKRLRATMSGESSRVVVRTDLNLRDTPGNNSSVLTTLPKGVDVSLTGEQADGWIELRWEDVTGWVLGRHLTAHHRQATRGGQSGDKDWSRAEIQEIIYAAADRYGQPREDMLRVARCESDLIPSAVNPYGGSYGIFQFKPGTWLSTPFAEFDIFDPRANSNAAAWMWSVGRRREWVCQ